MSKATHHRNSLLYKISNNGLRKPSYLFGTMHMICASDFEIPPRVYRAMGRCSIFYMEVDLGSAEELSTMQHQQLEESQLDLGLTADEKAVLENLLNKKLGLTLEEANGLPAVELINQMTTHAMGCDEIRVAELELLKVAAENGLRTAGLETALEQLEIAKQVFHGKELLLQLQLFDGDGSVFERMTKAYRSENLKELADLITHTQFMSEGAYDQLVVQRNKRWAEMIPAIIREARAFIAVGAGHLPGAQGVLQLLKEQGFSVNPVYR